MNWILFYNVLLLGLTIEEIVIPIFSILDRPFANIILQIYPSFVLRGNIGVILKFLNCQITIWGISISQTNIDIFIQLFYMILIFLFFLFVLSFYLDNQTFDENKKLLLIPEKYKWLYVNWIFGGLVNIISIIYLTCDLLIKNIRN